MICFFLLQTWTNFDLFFLDCGRIVEQSFTLTFTPCPFNWFKPWMARNLFYMSSFLGTVFVTRFQFHHFFNLPIFAQFFCYVLRSDSPCYSWLWWLRFWLFTDHKTWEITTNKFEPNASINVGINGVQTWNGKGNMYTFKPLCRCNEPCLKPDLIWLDEAAHLLIVFTFLPLFLGLRLLKILPAGKNLRLNRKQGWV